MTVITGAVNTPQDLRLAFEKITRNQHDIDDTYQLMMDELTILVSEIEPADNLSLDTSQIVTSNATYLTPYNLPADWGMTKKMVVDIIPYYPIRFEERIGYRFSARHYYIDYKNRKFYLTGVVANGPQVINHWYQSYGAPMTQSNETQDLEVLGIIPFPKRFYRLLAWGAAFVFLGGIDGEDVARVISQSQMAQYYRLRDAFTAWVAEQKLQSLDHRTGFAEDDDRPFDVGML